MIMHEEDNVNPVFKLALDLVEHTAQHIFLTGKAGTGKTTFLREVKRTTKKRAVIVAPTGVAAINAGGVTMHSFFQLPFGAFVPGSLHRENDYGFEVNDRHSLFKNIRFGAEKRELLEELELLIIDEVSMMRCDMLDAIDAILRHFRKAPHLPFGGVQVVYIGDLYQLPPVVHNEEWRLLGQYYESPFFFSARALSEVQPVYVELKKIYRQNEQAFIDVLNRVRNNALRQEDFDLLHQRYDPHFAPSGDDQYVTVTTHNKKADVMNRAGLDGLPGRLHTFRATIKNDFSEKALPTDIELQLKVGAQVMFIKNDSGAERRYFNGKLAIIESITGDEIKVRFRDNDEELLLEKETWKNVRYSYNKEKDDIEEEELGSFTQFPIRLAWAITVHKSQGLTFEKAVIDAGASFTPGQVYVALSRCTNLSGLVLKSRLYPQAIATDQRIIAFSQREAEIEQLEILLESEKYRGWSEQLVRLFNWDKLIGLLYLWAQSIPDKKLADVPRTLRLAQELLVKAKTYNETAQKFQGQLAQVAQQARSTGNTDLLQARMEKAIAYFAPVLANEFLKPVQEHIKEIAYNTKVKKYREEVIVLEGHMWQLLQKLVTASYGDLQFCKDLPAYQPFNPAEKKSPKVEKTKPSKGASLVATLQLFKEGKSASEIAVLRNLALGTVEGHLAQFVKEGKLHVSELVPAEKIDLVMAAIHEVGIESIGPIKAKLGDAFSFGEIRAVVNHHLLLQKAIA